jgi:hypothetical protein
VRKHVIKGRISFIVSAFESKKIDGIKNSLQKREKYIHGHKFQNRVTGV